LKKGGEEVEEEEENNFTIYNLIHLKNVIFDILLRPLFNIVFNIIFFFII
jgi:hypothetical protein